ncbi:phosphoglucosamine mutase [Oceanomicrobium pacificus]|uniref:Phosphoglucosamine mutase n=1 Tax=Oceanomicrobium pacificus TaxID=2692916 RepID=A0A6B0TW93_9RHOB|nr:phosphoglucosamine mutase [Oceanomicrobium pacificus]MXU65522.1 phosphoglucosamine mutase [Oceanomicrobium pacificus]
MSRQYFGTDGIRGRANSEPMTAATALAIGAAAGRYFRHGRGTHRAVIGKDTRRSGYMLETALTAGLTSVGIDVFLLGPVPTPAVGMLTRSMRADLGIMISASHNPSHDNGIKFFGPDGFKLSDEAEAEIETQIEGGGPLVEPDQIGRATRIDDGRGRYTEFAKTAFPKKLRLDGLKIVVDCANGAAYKSAPEVLWELGAEVIPVGVRPNGFNINQDCGSTDTRTAAETVVAHGADLGIALDGDADRVMILDETGRVADGDQLMALIAGRWADEGRLAGNTLVATVMSNLGLERHLEGRGLSLMRTAVGDRYVVEAMRANGFNVGGEQSGHIVMRDFVTTGDGLIAALQFLAAMVETGRRASELAQVFETVPQLLQNVRVAAGTAPLQDAAVQAAIAEGEARFGDRGRLLIRASGTEPLIRVMGECEDEALLAEVVRSIADQVSKAG